MNIYNYLYEIISTIKNESAVLTKYRDSKKKIEPLKHDMTYVIFFELCRSFSNYYFFAPNIAYQIINKIIENNEYNDIFSEDKCKKIVSDGNIKNFIASSTELNQEVEKESKKIMSPFEVHDNSKLNFLYNRIYDELGFIGLGKMLQNFSGKEKLLTEYLRERSKYIKEAEFVFPFKIVSQQYFIEKLKDSQTGSIYLSFENFNLIFTIIYTMFYALMDDKLLKLSKNDIIIEKTKNKENFKLINFITKKSDIFFFFPNVIKIDNDYFFTKRIKLSLGKENTAECECFKINFDRPNSLADFSILRID